jgi:hypothetical protein
MCHHYVRVFDLIAMHVYEVHELLITSSTNGWTEIEGWMDEDDKHSALKITFFPSNSSCIQNFITYFLRICVHFMCAVCTCVPYLYTPVQRLYETEISQKLVA